MYLAAHEFLDDPGRVECLAFNRFCLFGDTHSISDPLAIR